MPGAIKEAEKVEAAATTNGNGNGVHSKIKSIVLTSTGSGSDYSNLQVKEEEYPKLDPNREDQVIVRIKAVGLNFAELMQRQGMYKPQTKTPYTPGYEGSGIVEEIGSQVTDLKVDDRVLVFNSSGIWKEAVVLPRSNVIKIPDNMTFEDAAGLLVNYLTAYQLLFRMANLRPGNKVLIHMAAGGVGTALTQLCRTIEGVVIIGTASASKHEAIRANGVDHAIDYTSQDYVAEIKKLFPEGIDLVLDPLNGDHSIKGYDLLKPLGRIVHFGAASITSESRSIVNVFKAWWKGLTVSSLDIVSENKCVGGYHLGLLLNNPAVTEELKADIKSILDLFQNGKIKVKIDSTYSFSKIGEGMKRMHARLNIGKIILKPDSEIVEETPASTDQVNVTTPNEPVKESKSTPKDKKLERRESESKKNKNKSKVAESDVKKVVVEEAKKPIVDEIKKSEEVVAVEVKPVEIVKPEAVVADTESTPESTSAPLDQGTNVGITA